ncbi:hypothetical protein A1L58_16460 [Shewanella baltica]|nr:hypothetical protein A1L58_16460 [Shewanella baltica]
MALSPVAHGSSTSHSPRPKQLSSFWAFFYASAFMPESFYMSLHVSVLAIAQSHNMGQST